MLEDIRDFCIREKIIFNYVYQNDVIICFDINNQYIEMIDKKTFQERLKNSYFKFSKFIYQKRYYSEIENTTYSTYYDRISPIIKQEKKWKYTDYTLKFVPSIIYPKYSERFSLKEQEAYEYAYGLNGKKETRLCDMKIPGHRGIMNPKSLDAMIRRMTRVLKRYQEWEVIQSELEAHEHILTEKEKQLLILLYGVYEPVNLTNQEIQKYLEDSELDIKKEQQKVFQKMKIRVKRRGGK